MKFEALETFTSEETKSRYVQGGLYTVRTEKLARLVQKWVREGKAQVTQIKPGAKIKGAAKVG